MACNEDFYLVNNHIHPIVVALLMVVGGGCAVPQYTVTSAGVAAAKGDARADYFLGKRYADGDGVPQDFAKAAEYLRRSADQGNASAQCDLGVFYAQGSGVKQDYGEALKWFQRAANCGDGIAEYSLGMSYALGRGTDTNLTEAVKWYERAARNHVLEAKLELGDIYLGGRGQTANYQTARKWYGLAARQGSLDAVNALGYIAEMGGCGVKKDLNVALKYYRRAAEAGDGRGQANLGRLYLEGVAVPPDHIEAYKWFYLAARNGGGIAPHYLMELEGTANYRDFKGDPLTPDQIKEGVRRAQEFERSLHGRQG